MANSSTQQPSIRRYRVRPPEVWREVRLGWARGESGPSLACRFDIPVSSIYQRRDREKWARDADVQASLLEVRHTEVAVPTPTGALEIAETTLARAAEALALGRPTDAMALIKAGDAVGAFADFVARLRRAEGGAGACFEGRAQRPGGRASSAEATPDAGAAADAGEAWAAGAGDGAAEAAASAGAGPAGGAAA